VSCRCARVVPALARAVSCHAACGGAGRHWWRARDLWVCCLVALSVCVRVCAPMCVRACVRACACANVCVCACAYVCVPKGWLDGGRSQAHALHASTCPTCIHMPCVTKPALSFLASTCPTCIHMPCVTKPSLSFLDGDVVRIRL